MIAKDNMYSTLFYHVNAFIDNLIAAYNILFCMHLVGDYQLVWVLIKYQELTDRAWLHF